jgi:AcrR family transcriptional regulator
LADPATLRRDGRRNRARLVSAAQELFAEVGLSAPAEEIARRADLAVTTLYRHFPNRDLLVAAVTERFMDRMMTVVEQALACEDPWEGLVQVFRAWGEPAAHNPGFAQLVATLAWGGIPSEHRYVALKKELIERCQAAGRLRPDVTFFDVGCLTLSLTTVAWAAERHTPGLWMRHLAILLDGLQGRGALPLVDDDRSAEASGSAGKPPAGRRAASA